MWLNRASKAWADIAATAALPLLSLWLFRQHVFGAVTYIGNPDRLTSHLKVLKLHVDALTRGQLDAWSEFEMLGYDSFALPYTFPNILTYLGYWFGPESLYVTAGYISAGLLALAGIAAYGFIRGLVRQQFAALVGAILYQFSALTVLKASQNDMSLLVFVVIPWLALIVRRTGRKGAASSFALLAGLVFLLLHFTFLQTAAYVLMFMLAYATYRSWALRDWRPLAVCGGAMAVGTLFAGPRLLGVALAMREHVRVQPGHKTDTFEGLYQFQNIRPYEIVRWFDGTVFGRFPSEAEIIGNNINLTEGFLLSTAALTPFVIGFAILHYRQRLFGLLYEKRDDAAFMFWALAFCFSVIALKPVHYLVFLLFLGVDFTHARILIVGLLPLATLVALALVDLGSRHATSPFRQPTRMVAMAGICLGLAMVLGIEAVANLQEDTWWQLSGPGSLRVLAIAATRIVLSAMAAGILIAIIIASGRSRRLSVVVRSALGLGLAMQTVIAADFQVNGAHTRIGETPFLAGNNYASDRTEFRPPSPAQIAALGERVETDRFRSIVICDAAIAGGFCDGHIAEFWRLRLVGGYYGIGVPARLAVFPWGDEIGLRSLRFTDPDHLPWPLLGLMNVKYAVFNSGALYRNRVVHAEGSARPTRPDDLRIAANPVTVVPRFFFARAIEPIGSAARAASKLVEGRRAADPAAVSFVEGLTARRDFTTAGRISVSGGGDRLDIVVDPAAQDRFLVVNELYAPGWRVTVDGVPAMIYPTNAFMRGVVVPAGVRTVALRYVPFVRRPAALAFYGAGLIFLALGWLLFRRAQRADTFVDR